MVDIKKIDAALERVVGNKYEIEKHQSKTTNSYYVALINGEMRVQLRFSDHTLNKKRNLQKTFLMDASQQKKGSLEKYIKDQMEMLERISLYHAFDTVFGTTAPINPKFNKPVHKKREFALA